MEGGADLDILRALAERLGHPAAKKWDERINSYYVQNNFPEVVPESELKRVEGGFGLTPKQHFRNLRYLLPNLIGLAILDNDGKGRTDFQEGGLQVTYWRRYEAENYFRFKIGGKVAYFFNGNFGMESEYFFGQTLTGMDTTDDGNIDTMSKQNRHALLLSFALRQAIDRLNVSAFYGGMGAGGIYSDFEAIGNSWDYGGQVFLGVNYPMSRRHVFFFEMKYFWAPDVADFGVSAGKHYKTSGHNSWNPANHIFGPHCDTQVVALMVGARFKLRD